MYHARLSSDATGFFEAAELVASAMPESDLRALAVVILNCTTGVAAEIAASRQDDGVEDEGALAAMREGLEADRAADNLPSGD